MHELRPHVLSILAAALALRAGAMGIAQLPAPIEAGNGAGLEAPVGSGVGAGTGAGRQAEPGTGGVFPDTTMGRCAAAFIETVNDGSEAAVRKFEGTWSSKARATQRTIEEWVASYARLHTDWGKVTPLSCSDSSGALVVKARTSTGLSMKMDFQADAGEPGKLLSIIVESQEGPSSEPINADQRGLLVHGVVNALAASYVFPEVGNKMGMVVLDALEKGAYDNISDEAALAEQLTSDLRKVSDDKHLRVRLAPAGTARGSSPMPVGDVARRDNYAFRKVEVLPGNIGYLRFDLFMDQPEAKTIATAAMEFLHNCDAVIFDLRSNGGGSPEMIRFITSYFVPSKTHLNSMVDRGGNTVQEYWTLDSVPGQRLGDDIPVFVLTSGRTFSGAEEFSYNLKNLKRATVVGETTGGGAHPVRMERLNDRFVIGVPYMRAQNPITGTNWEGTGVEPDVKVPQAAALDKALELARAAAAARPRTP